MSNELVLSNTEIVIQEPPNDDEMFADMKTARTNLNNMLEKSNEALEGIMAVALQSQHPRAYEVLAGFLKTQAELNKDLVQIADTKDKKLRNRERNGESPNITHNQTLNFVGTTAQLGELIKGTTKK